MGRDDHTDRSRADGDDGSDGKSDGGHDFFFSEEGNDDEHEGDKYQADKIFLFQKLDGSLHRRKYTVAILSPNSIRSLRCSSVMFSTKAVLDYPLLSSTLIERTCMKLIAAQTIPRTQLRIMTMMEVE